MEKNSCDAFRLLRLHRDIYIAYARRVDFDILTFYTSIQILIVDFLPYLWGCIIYMYIILLYKIMISVFFQNILLVIFAIF